MGLFNNDQKETKEEKKKKEQLERLKRKFNLNNFDDNVIESLKKIDSDLAGAGILKAGLALSCASGVEQAKLGYLSALMEQNWIIINLLNDIKNKQ